MTTTTSTMRAAVCRVAMISVLAVAGCEKKKDAPAKSPVPKPPTPDVTPKAIGGGVGSAVSTGSPIKAPIATTQPSKGSTATAPVESASAGSAQPDKSVEQTKQAQDLIAKAIQSMKDNRFDDARQSLDKVAAMKDSLPPTLQKQLTSVRESLASVEKLQNAVPATAADPDNK